MGYVTSFFNLSFFFSSLHCFSLSSQFRPRLTSPAVPSSSLNVQRERKRAAAEEGREVDENSFEAFQQQTQSAPQQSPQSSLPLPLPSQQHPKQPASSPAAPPSSHRDASQAYRKAAKFFFVKKREGSEVEGRGRRDQSVERSPILTSAEPPGLFGGLAIRRAEDGVGARVAEAQRRLLCSSWRRDDRGRLHLSIFSRPPIFRRGGGSGKKRQKKERERENTSERKGEGERKRRKQSAKAR